MTKTKIRIDAVKGRGVYAEEPVKKGAAIEDCHLIVMDFDHIAGVLERYVFDFGPKKVALALGNGSLYNHSDRPNAKCWMDTRKKILSFKALRPIQVGEEITINYGYTKEDRKRFQII